VTAIVVSSALLTHDLVAIAIAVADLDMHVIATSKVVENTNTMK
jgi:hypothetical protein